MTDEDKRTKVEVNVKVDDNSKKVTRTTTTTTHVTSSSNRLASLLAAYEAWVGSHAGLARNVETTLYVAPQLMSKQVMEPEVATQFGYSLVGLLHLYHDYILWKKSSKEMESRTNWHKLTRLIRVPLSLILHIQVLAEVVAHRVGGDVGKWRLIVWIEVVKAVLRFTLLAQHRRLMLIRGGKYNGVESAPRSSVFARFTKVKQPGARMGKIFGKSVVSEMDSTAEKRVEESNKIFFEDATIDVVESSREDFLAVGEICHILRPVAYALLRRRRPATSWTPVVASLIVELTGLALSVVAIKPAKSASSDKAMDEIVARKMVLLLYLLRDPVLATVTKPATGKVADVLDYVPVVGKLFRFGTTAILDYYHQFYFNTSAS